MHTECPALRTVCEYILHVCTNSMYMDIATCTVSLCSVRASFLCLTRTTAGPSEGEMTCYDLFGSPRPWSPKRTVRRGLFWKLEAKSLILGTFRSVRAVPQVSSQQACKNISALSLELLHLNHICCGTEPSMSVKASENLALISFAFPIRPGQHRLAVVTTEFISCSMLAG